MCDIGAQKNSRRSKKGNMLNENITSLTKAYHEYNAMSTGRHTKAMHEGANTVNANVMQVMPVLISKPQVKYISNHKEITGVHYTAG